ncbi:NAD(P)/FAD-dependent oxidoreductase [Thalassotalea sp. Y01]|uniref:flavin-containing monooxygenase n=1 Tax=Thalassotalea sp. Y01 TaxID=2729613 RepID=UPI00145FC786|nr:NAD(P)/FAD-dependent oxidoreductase [Thalassotalea sp. Y01]NMP15836.1 NAD(P)-binding domain-containing protein [Thalassotalea sp. Y01]
MYQFIIVGGSQAGLAMAQQLQTLDASFLVVDAGPEVGSSWLSRWHSLTLFTPKKYNNLPGLAFECEREYPNKDDVAHYLKRYVATFNIPLQLNTKVEKLTGQQGAFTLHTNQGELSCQQVIVATGPFHTPFLPSCAEHIGDDIVQIHSREYQSPEQLQPGKTLVVGGGDSGVQILKEVAQTNRDCYISGISSMASLPQQFLGKTLWWWLKSFGILSLNKYSYLGRQIKKRMQPVIGTNVKALLSKSNVTTLPRITAAQNNRLDFEGESIADIKNIIWATGYKPDYRWLGNIEFDETGYPVNYRGVGECAGMYFIGLPWMHTRGSATLGGVAKDAEYLSQYFQQQQLARPLNSAIA